MAYMGAATSLVHQGRMRVPTAEWDRPDSTSTLSLWPPGFPAVIALPVFLGASPVQSARWINIIAAAVLAGTIVLVVAAPLGLGAGLIAAAIVVATQPVVDAHLSVLSEPLFMAVMLLMLATMVYARDRLLLLGVVATAAVMVRYAGAAAPAAAVIWTLLDGRRDLGTRVRRAITVSILPLAFIALWFARTVMAPDRHATPKLSVYGGWGATLAQARDTFSEWLAPLLPDGTLQRLIALGVAVLLAAFVLTAASDTAGNRLRQLRVRDVASILGATSLLGACYLVVVLGSRAFIGGTIPLDWRILAPLIVLIEVAVVTAIAYWWRAYHRPAHVAIAVLALAWFAATATLSANDAIYTVTEGSDFAGASWRHSALTQWVINHANGRPLYSNWPPALYFYGNRIARELPVSADSARVSRFAAQLRKDHGYVVAFDEPSPDFIPPATLARELNLRQVVRTSDGAVWTADPAVPGDSLRADSVATAAAGSPRPH